MRALPRIRNQKNSPHCYAAAICGVVEYHLDDGTRLDEEDFHDEVMEILGNRRANTTKVALKHARDFGIPVKNSGRRVLIKDYKPVRPGDVWGYPEPLVIGCDIETGESLTKRLSKKSYIKRRLRGYHECVYVETISVAVIRIANSWGTKWGDKGYFYLKRTMQKSNDPFIMDAHEIFI